VTRFEKGHLNHGFLQKKRGPHDEILTLKGVAKLLNVSEQTIRRMILEKRIPYFLVRSRKRFSKQKVLEHFYRESNDATV